jgi:hypothetical protein
MGLSYIAKFFYKIFWVKNNESVDYPTKTPPLIFRIEIPPPIFSSNIKFPAMINRLTIGVIVVLLLLMLGSSMLMFLFNSTSLPSDVCSDCYPLTQDEIQTFNLSKYILVFSSIGLLGFWIKNEIK